MTGFVAVGLPGAPPRLLIEGAGTDQLRGGEVAVPVDGPGDWLILADGLSAIPRPLGIEERRAEAWRRVKARRRQAEAGGCETPLGRVQTDAESLNRISATALRALTAPAGWTADWTFADNAAATLDSAQVQALAGAVGDFFAAVHARAQALRAQIMASDAEALDVLGIDAGWPL